MALFSGLGDVATNSKSKSHSENTYLGISSVLCIYLGIVLLDIILSKHALDG